MNRIFVVSLLVGSALYAGCSSDSGSTPVGQSGQDLAASTGSSGPQPPPICPPGEKACKFGEPTGSTAAAVLCAYKCVPLNVMCIAPPDCGGDIGDPCSPYVPDDCDPGLLCCPGNIPGRHICLAPNSKGQCPPVP